MTATDAERQVIGDSMAAALATLDDAVHPLLIHKANSTTPTEGEWGYLLHALTGGELAAAAWHAANRRGA